MRGGELSYFIIELFRDGKVPLVNYLAVLVDVDVVVFVFADWFSAYLAFHRVSFSSLKLSSSISVTRIASPLFTMSPVKCNTRQPYNKAVLPFMQSSR